MSQTILIYLKEDNHSTMDTATESLLHQEHIEKEHQPSPLPPTQNPSPLPPHTNSCIMTTFTDIELSYCGIQSLNTIHIRKILIKQIKQQFLGS